MFLEMKLGLSGIQWYVIHLNYLSVYVHMNSVFSLADSIPYFSFKLSTAISNENREVVFFVLQNVSKSDLFQRIGYYN